MSDERSERIINIRARRDGRRRAACGGDAALRAAGISPQKLGYLRNLTEHSAAGRLDFRNIHNNSDEEIIDSLVAMKVYKLRKMPSEDKLMKLAAPWRPYRTVGCWYLWRSLDAEGKIGE
ncbi:MAG: hypothetical protein HY286_06375 [Planctomycetes bacterium]|nr:hypothetical protein [Planctomycetota bacterium]